MTKKMTIAVAVLMCICSAFARPHGGPHGGFGWGHRPPPPMHHGVWGRGGCNFWPGFVGGVLGGVVSGAITPAPIVVTPPTVVSTPVVVRPEYVAQQVWIPGRYIDQVSPNGAIVRVWQPGHWEYR